MNGVDRIVPIGQGLSIILIGKVIIINSLWKYRRYLIETGH